MKRFDAKTISEKILSNKSKLDAYAGDIVEAEVDFVMVNDVTAGRYDPGMFPLVAKRGCPMVLMHMRGEPKSMQDDPRYDDVVDEVLRFLEERMAFALARGLREDQLMVDPGIGFGKTVDHNLALLRDLRRFTTLGRPVVLGTSRKRFLGAILGGFVAAPLMKLSPLSMAGAADPLDARSWRFSGW